ncbi:NACHT domain-containing protein [Streptomyces sp. NPDC008001]|uniref:NACHT domain-containing protein n=1 Tax=Streptomyces sp. NPDC008001 TaxID=3364804 RepID=UPI0036F1225A
MPDAPEGRRAGRPWGPLRGASREANEVAEALRTWLDEAGISVGGLHARLSPEHFPDHAVPVRRKLYDLCAGKGLTWPFVEAVADVCTPGDADAQQRKLADVRELWEAARDNPTPWDEPGPAHRELVAAKDRIIAAYERIDRLQQARADSEFARMRTNQLVMVLLTMLGRLQATISDLRQDRNRLLAERTPDPRALTVVEGHLREAEDQREGTEEAVRRAERERDEALRLADGAQRLVQRLQEEVGALRRRYGGLEDTGGADGDFPHFFRGGESRRVKHGISGTNATDGIPVPPDPDAAFLRDYAEALSKARSVLDTGSDALRAAEEEIAQASAALPPDTGGGESGAPAGGLSRTTPHNPVTRADAAFEERYREYVVERYGHVEIFGAALGQGGHEPWPLDLAYLSLELAGTSAMASERVEHALAGRQRTVVMGPAGSGKTMLLQWLAVNAARRTLPDRLRYLNGCVPFVVSLRSLDLAPGDPLPPPGELLAAVACPLDLVGRRPHGWADRILEQGRALVLVDGVDEVPPERRARTREWLQRMLEAHPRGCYVVTTRATAVPESWLDDVGFRHLMLRPMNSADVRAFIAAWHEAARAGEGDRERRLLGELESTLQAEMLRRPDLSALAATPLLCALVCALHRDRRGVLPIGRMDMYEAALDMLLVRRDAERRITGVEGVRLSREESMRLLQALASWLIRNGRFRIDRDIAVRVLERVVCDMPDLVVSGTTPAQVLHHLLVRSGVLREPLPGSVEFIHRTFQDYLAARDFVEEASFGELEVKAHHERWENVIRMATAHARPSERTGILFGLLRRGDLEETHRAVLHRLAGSCLEYAPQLDPIVREEVRQRIAALEDTRAREQRCVFGDDAEQYDAARPGYPEELVDDVLEFARLDRGVPALEVGAGTGKATLAFASRGIPVTCVEPDERMARALRERCAGSHRDVTVHVADFETWRASADYGLLYCAQAWHWVDPDVRWARAKAALLPGAAAALFWNHWILEYDGLVASLTAAHARHDVDVPPHTLLDPRPRPAHHGPAARHWREMDGEGLVDLRHRLYESAHERATSGLMGLLASYAGYRVLPPERREPLFGELARIVEDQGGRARVKVRTSLFLGRLPA